VRVLVTGVSATGKSALVKELRRRDYCAFDADDDGFTTPLEDGTWAWRPDLITALFDQLGDELVFFAGCSDEQADFDFDFKVLLTAPVQIIVERLQLRTTNTFGKTQAQQDRVLADMVCVLPLLRASADLVIETTRPINEVADTVVDAVASDGGRARRT
jgi:dephospho-CoA kinase